MPVKTMINSKMRTIVERMPIRLGFSDKYLITKVFSLCRCCRMRLICMTRTRLSIIVVLTSEMKEFLCAVSDS